MSAERVVGRNAKWFFAVVTFCAGAVLVEMAVGRFYRPTIGAAPDSSSPEEAPVGRPQTPVRGVRNLREVEGWAPEDFFDSNEVIQACRLITEHKHDELKKLIDAGLDVNASGYAGMRLLYWAWAEDNLEAFKLLLASGADPDAQLTDGVRLDNGRFLHPCDSILFSIMRNKRIGMWDFFFAALDHSSDVNQRGVDGHGLLYTCMSSHMIFSTNEEMLQHLLDARVELDEQNDNGETPAMNALAWGRPLFSLRILEAGADPEIRNKQGRTIADLLAIRMQHARRRGDSPPPGTDRLQAWLEAHQQTTNKEQTPE